MVIERSGFLLMAGTLAAGGVGGWLAHEAKAQRARTPFAEPPTTAVPVASSSAPIIIERAPAPPVPALPPACDDNVGTVEDCPAMGPADEGVCTNFAAKRCSEFKSAFKPKVAEAAVACVKNLKGNAACDPARVNLCGHSALMAACPEPAPDPLHAPAAEAAGSSSLTAGSSSLTSACEAISRGCAGQPLPPSLADCRQTLAGMSEFGRASMVECMAKHCGDKGLLGCEASKPQSLAGQ